MGIILITNTSVIFIILEVNSHTHATAPSDLASSHRKMNGKKNLIHDV